LVLLSASEGLFDGRGQHFVIDVEDEDCERLRRLGLARVAADGPALEMAGRRRRL
jgi:hypothetical protein